MMPDRLKRSCHVAFSVNWDPFSWVSFLLIALPPCIAEPISGPLNFEKLSTACQIHRNELNSLLVEVWPIGAVLRALTT